MLNLLYAITIDPPITWWRCRRPRVRLFASWTYPACEIVNLENYPVLDEQDSMPFIFQVGRSDKQLDLAGIVT